MQQHLERCLALGWSEHRIEALFPSGADRDPLSPQRLLGYQERILAAAEAGMAADVLADKLREGRMKGAGPEAIERAMNRLEQHVRAAHRVLAGAVDDGVVPTGRPDAERRLQRGLALGFWRGLEPADADALREQARLRLRDRTCTTVDLAAAAESTTEWIEAGVERDRAREMMGLALRNGYTAEEMRRLGAMARNGDGLGEAPEEMLARMRNGLEDGADLQRMFREMERHGWLGPRDLQGPGGNSPVDDVLGGPGRHGGGAGSGPGGSGDPGPSGGDTGSGGQQGGSRR